MSKGTEGPSGTAATLLHVITLSGFIDLEQSNKSTPVDISVISYLRFYKVSAETHKPLGGTVVLFLCGNIDIPRLPHIYWDLPIPHSVSQLDMAMLCGVRDKQQLCQTYSQSGKKTIPWASNIFLLHDVTEHLYLCLCGLRLLSLLLW